MCEILTLRAQRADPVDQDRNTRQLWHRGYPIQVQPDGHPWSRRERKAEWLADGGDAAAWHGQTQLFLLPGEAVDGVLRGDGTPDDPFVLYTDLLLPQNEDDDGNPLFEDEQGNASLVDLGFGPFKLRRRLWQVSETLPPPWQAELDLAGEFTVSPVAQFNAFVKRSKEGDTVPSAASRRARRRRPGG